MKTWNDHKDHVKSIDPEAKKDIEEAEELASICGIPQSSVARIESYKTTPNLDTLLKIMQPLGLKLTVSAVSD